MALRILACMAVTAISAMGLLSLMAGPRLAPASAPPATFSISMPDYHRVDRKIWIGEANDVCLNLRAIADESLKTVSDGRLTIDERTVALSTVELFSARVTAAILIESIELEDKRTERFAISGHGRYPVVTVLAEYGEPVVEHINFALSNDDNTIRRKLMCDVLQKAVGLNRARQLVSKYLAEGKFPEERTRRLEVAVAELATRSETIDTR